MLETIHFLQFYYWLFIRWPCSLQRTSSALPSNNVWNLYHTHPPKTRSSTIANHPASPLFPLFLYARTCLRFLCCLPRVAAVASPVRPSLLASFRLIRALLAFSHCGTVHIDNRTALGPLPSRTCLQLSLIDLALDPRRPRWPWLAAATCREPSHWKRDNACSPAWHHD